MSVAVCIPLSFRHITFSVASSTHLDLSKLTLSKNNVLEFNSDMTRESVFLSTSEDALIYILSFLEPPDILRVSETCKAMHKLAFQRVVWANACTNYIISRGHPFPQIHLDELSTAELIYHTNHAFSLARRWIAGIHEPKRIKFVTGTAGTAVSDVRFVPGNDDNLLLTISKTVWSTLGIWFIGSDNPQKVCEWSPRGAIFNGFTLNSDPKSEATIAISLHLNEVQTVKILSLQCTGGLEYSLREVQSFAIDMEPITLHGDLVALSDNASETAIWNWRTGEYAILQNLPGDPSSFLSNHCLQVLFTHESILVVRARNIHLFAFPELHPSGDPPTPCTPLAQNSFGWVDAEHANICPFLDRQESTASHLPISILVRGESDDPWASDVYNLELHTLDPNPDPDADSAPYIFPPRLTSKVSCLRGSLRCKQVILGRFGTAAWIQPRDRSSGGLVDVAVAPSHLNTHESLVVAAFPGSMLSPGHEVVGTKVFENEFNAAWSSFDYDEIGGRVALGSSFGRVTVLYL